MKTKEPTITYNTEAFKRFTELMLQIDEIDKELKQLNEVAQTCSGQQLKAFVTLTILDVEKLKILNRKSAKEEALKKLSRDMGDGGGMMIALPFGYKPPAMPSPEQQEKDKMMEQNLQNAAQASVIVNTDHNSSVSLRIIQLLKEDFLQRRELVQKEANIIYKQIFKA